MGLVKDEIDKYKAQVETYDAGRPTTQSAEKLGNRVVPDSGPQFDASYDAKKLSMAQGRGPMPFKGFDASQDAKATAAARMPVGDNRSPLMGGTDLDKMQQNFMRFAANSQNAASIEQKAQADSRAAQPNYYLGDERARLDQALRSNTVRKPLSAPVVGASTSSQQAQQDAKTDPSKNAFAGNYAAADATGQGVYTDPETKRTSIRLTGEAGDKFMQDQDKLIAEGKGKATTAEDMAARRKAMGEYSGMFRQPAPEAPLTARPGNTLQASPVEYRRNVVGSKTVGGLPAEESFTPTRAAQSAQRAAIPMTGNPIADQRNAEAALAARQAEVMQAERNTPGLLYGPGSRDYIDPRLSETEQRARQMEIAEQRIEDMRQARDATIAQTQARDAALAYNGLPTDEARNRAMEPYAERRTTLNQRNANMAIASEQEAARDAAKAAGVARTDAMARAQMEDSRLRDINAEDNAAADARDARAYDRVVKAAELNAKSRERDYGTEKLLDARARLAQSLSNAMKTPEEIQEILDQVFPMPTNPADVIAKAQGAPATRK